MNIEFILKVGPAHWLWRTARRQLFKRVLQRPHAMRLPSGVDFPLPLASKFASEAFVTNANVDWGSERLLFDLLDGHGTFLDIGANIGYYSAYMSPRVQGVYAFEPDPRVLPLLRDAMQLVGNASVIDSAVGAQVGVAAFTLETNGEVSHLAGPDDTDRRNVEVLITTVDRFVAERGLQVTAIKTDVEGFDFAVLQGAAGTMSRQRPIVLSEIGYSKELREFADSLDYVLLAYVYSAATRVSQLRELTGPNEQGQQTKMIFIVPRDRREQVLSVAAGLH